MKKIAQLYIFLICVFVAFNANATEYFTMTQFTFSGNEHYLYLKNSVPSMLSARIFKNGVLESTEEINTVANYIITGTITAIENTISIDISITRKNEVYSFPITTTANTLIQDITTTATSIQNTLCNSRDTTIENSPQEGLQKTFSPEDFSVWKESQDLPYTARSFVIDDINGDGIAEIIILSETSLHIYHLEDTKLKELSKHNFYSRLQPISVSVADVAATEGKEILVTTLTNGRTPYSYIFSYHNSQITVLLDGINALLGSYYDYITKTHYPLLQYVRTYPNPFFGMPLYSFSLENKKILTEKALSLPKEANPFNITVIKTQDGVKNFVILPTEKIAIYNGVTQKEEYLSRERYSGTTLSLLLYPSKENIQDKTPSFKDWYYMPMKIIPYEQKTKDLFLFINQPPELSAALSFSSSYRSFNKTNIVSLVLRNNTLTKVWSSPEIASSVEAIAIHDLNSDTIPELVVLANTYKGFLHFKKSTSRILYLSLTQE
ncbi:MAG: FG-GAP repeat domain-containing protein [Desulfovibrionaceae bacterium]